MDYPSVSKLPALNIDTLRDVSKSIEDFVNRFPGVNAYRSGRYFDFAHRAMFYPGPVLLKSSMVYDDFKKLARNIFINTKTKTTLVFLGGVESYRQVDMLFSAAVGAIPGLAKWVGMAECIAFYPDLMCAEYDFIGLGLKELLQDSRYGITNLKINCINGHDRDGNDNEENVFRYREDLINKMPFVVVETCNVAQRLINNGLAITKATANNFAVDIKDNTRPILAILDCLSPLGYDLKMAERQFKKTQWGALAQNRMWFEEVEKEERMGKKEVTFSEEAVGTDEKVDNYPFFQDKNETFHCVPANITPSFAPEITNMSISNGGQRIDNYSEVSEATEASTAYMIGKVLEETLGVAKNASRYDVASSNSVVIDSPTKSLLLSNEIMNMITIMCSDTPEMCCPVSFLSKAVINFMNVITGQK
uniref:Protein kinase n=1 Tax=Hemigrapsus takanoi nimavirus TaxID=2133792 RepID=A0A401IP57_9VIRU|nr:MAG: protein kinase [Hemigrapsus takanoi nimavirus]GBG35395.1 protein kinase [Hemigrapsus takanoi nimavirus]